MPTRTGLVLAIATTVALIQPRQRPAPLAPLPVAEPTAPDPPPLPMPPRVRVEHLAAPGETLATVALRYGVSVAHLCALNGARCHDLQPGDRLILHAEDPPLPPQRLTHIVEPDELSWSALAARFGVPEARARAMNPGLPEPIVGAEIHLWIDPDLHPTPDFSAPLHEVLAPAAAIAAPDDGLLQAGLPLPQSPLYTRRHPQLMFANATLLAHLPAAIARLRGFHGFRGELVVADISRAGGGPLPPHHSHQSGRDVDIWLPALRGPHAAPGPLRRPFPDEVHWLAAWALVESLAATDAVEVIFLACHLQPRLHAAARTLGVGELALAHLLQWQPGVSPDFCSGPRPDRGLVRHATGHDRHIHVRFRCAPHESQCRGIHRPTAGE